MTRLRAAGLFAGIGGIERGLENSGIEAAFLCELDPGARRVLEVRFSGVPLVPDVTQVDELPDVELVSAGFPCQDLSQAGSKQGIEGGKSGLVEHLFQLLSRAKDAGRQPPFVLIENVSYMLRLGRGQAMDYLVTRLEALDYRWAYRVVDSRAFGVPQRRQRVIMLASLEEDPAPIVLGEDAGEPDAIDAIGAVQPSSVYGFYWTEGKRGLGWARDAIPTLKGGSGLGIPSPPAIWTPESGYFGTPTLEDAERLQGLPAGWTEPADEVYPRPRRFRWTLAGNAVCVPVAEWIGRRLVERDRADESTVSADPIGGRWPRAAYGSVEGHYAVDVSMRPRQDPFVPLGRFLRRPLEPLSQRAGRGFLSRAKTGRLRFADGFLDSLDRYLAESDEEFADRRAA